MRDKSLHGYKSLLFLLILTVSLAACREKHEGSMTELVGSVGIDGGSIVVSLPQPLVYLDPFDNRSDKALSIYYFMYDKLIDIDESLHFVPRLAKSWELSDDLLSITFHLRDDVHFHNDRLFTADDVLYSYSRYRTIEVPNRPGHRYFERVEKVESTDPYTVKVYYKQPYSFGLADWVIEILPRPADGGSYFIKTPQKPVPIGSGPYIFKTYDLNEQKITLQVYEPYWNGRSHLDEIQIKFVATREVNDLFFQSGKLDLARLGKKDVSKDAIESIREDYNLLDYTSLSYYYIGWKSDGSNPFFHHRRIRKAMTLSLPRKKLLHLLFAGKGDICEVPVPPWVIEDNLRKIPYSPILAAELIREVGFKDRNSDGIREKDGKQFTFTLLYPLHDPYAQEIVRNFQESLRKLGVRLRPLALPAYELKRRINNGEFDAFLIEDKVAFDFSNLKMYIDGTPDEQTTDNILGYKDPEMTDLLHKLFDGVSGNEFQVYMNKLIDRMIQEQPGTFILFKPEFFVLKQRLKMVRPSPHGLWEWYPSFLDWYIPQELQQKKTIVSQ